MVGIKPWIFTTLSAQNIDLYDMVGIKPWIFTTMSAQHLNWNWGLHWAIFWNVTIIISSACIEITDQINIHLLQRRRIQRPEGLHRNRLLYCALCDDTCILIWSMYSRVSQNLSWGLDQWTLTIGFPATPPGHYLNFMKQLYQANNRGLEKRLIKCCLGIQACRKLCQYCCTRRKA